MFAERVSHVKPSAGVFAEGSAKNSEGSEIERPMFVRIANSQSQGSAFFKGENAAQVSRERSFRSPQGPAANARDRSGSRAVVTPACRHLAGASCSVPPC